MDFVNLEFASYEEFLGQCAKHDAVTWTRRESMNEGAEVLKWTGTANFA